MRVAGPHRKGLQVGRFGTHAHGLPSDHTSAFASLAGTSFVDAQATAHGTARYISTLEYGYALHELTFGLLFLAVVISRVPAGPALGLVRLLGGVDRCYRLQRHFWGTRLHAPQPQSRR